MQAERFELKKKITANDSTNQRSLFRVYLNIQILLIATKLQLQPKHNEIQKNFDNVWHTASIEIWFE